MIRLGWSLFLTLCLALPPGAAAAKKSSMTLDDIAHIKSITDAAIAPDGQSIAFVESNPRDPFEDKDGKAWSILKIKRKDMPARVYGTKDLNVSDFAWAPDSSALYFVGKRSEDKRNALYVVALDGGLAQKVCALDQRRKIRSFDIHPDGRRLAIVSAPAKSKAMQRAKKMGFDAIVHEEGVKRAEVAIIQPGATKICKVKPISRKDHVASAKFSPRGDRLLLRVTPTPLVDDRYMQSRMRVVGLDGKERAKIENKGKLGPARWSPDGRHVAFIGVDDFNDPSAGRLKVADAGSGAYRDLLLDLPGQAEDFAWLDNRTLVAVIHFGVESEVWKVDIGTGKHVTLLGQGQRIFRSVSAAKTGSLALLADAPDHPTELFLLEGEQVERLTNSNPWLADRILGRQTLVEYEARDGLKLQGLLIYPTRYRKGRRYPLLIFVHGGPEAHRSNGWLTRYSTPIHVAASRGYASFVPNYRGSTGRGVEFSKASQHGYATPEFDDIVDGKNYLVKLGVVDRKKVGITGGSYGGYATAWSATALTEHYAAGVMFVGISDQISKFGTTDIPNEMHAVHARAWPWEDWQFMLERSPIYHAPKSKTPLLIMHGDSDPRVHPSQSLELYRYLKTVGQAPVRLVWYPGEGHGNRRAASRYDYSVRFMRWMDHYLKGRGGTPPSHAIDYSARINDDNGS